MTRAEVTTHLGADWTAFETLFREALLSDVPLLNKLNESVLSNSGKQLRPMMALLTARACSGACKSDSYSYAAVSEVLHNATLIHDDVADESTLRRGKPTLSSLMGPTVAVLVGDYWLARAVSLIIGTAHQMEVTSLFSKTLSDLAEGEMLQLQKAADADTAEEDYLRIVFCKTASLFEATCVSAALSVDASGEQCEAVRRYAVATGMAFQIRDDIFDYWDEANIGKPVGIDLKEQKITMPLLGALRNSSPSEDERIRRMIREIPEHPEYCGQIHAFVLENGGVEYASDRLNEYIDEAVGALKRLPASDDRDILERLVKYNAVRKK